MKKLLTAFLLALLLVWSFSAVVTPTVVLAQDDEEEETSDEDSDDEEEEEDSDDEDSDEDEDEDSDNDSDEDANSKDSNDEDSNDKDSKDADSDEDSDDDEGLGKKSRASVEPVDTGKSLGIPTEGKEAADQAVLRLGDFNYPFRWCPAGKFTMGSPVSEQGRHIDENQHEVDLTHGFWMLETEVTLKMFSQFVRETGYVTEAEKDEQGGYAIDIKTGMFLGPDKKYNWKNTGMKQKRDFPVVNVTWNDAQAFVAWMNKKFSDIAGVPQPALIAALPTEAQWEYACRAGQEHAFGKERDQDYMKDSAHLRSLTTSRKMNTLWGMDDLPWVIRADQPHIYTELTNYYLPNEWGLFDMYGNIWEWCQDWHEKFDVISVVDPKGASEGESRVFRAGAWDTDYAYARCAARAGNVPSRRFVTLGFRIVLNPFVQPEAEEKEKVEMSDAEKFYEYYDTRLDREKTELHRHNRHVERDFDSDEIHSWDRPENKNLEPYRIPNDPYDRPLAKPQGWNVNY